MSDSKNPFVRGLFGGSAPSVGKRSGKLAYVSVASKFRGQLEELMEKLNSTVRSCSISRVNEIYALRVFFFSLCDS